LTATLRREQIQVTKVNPVKEEKAAKAKKPKGRKVAAKNLAVFTRQFSVMIDAGLPLVQCLDILGNQEEDKGFSSVILQTRSDVESGASLADAMRKHPKTFDGLFVNMIAAGEAGGILDTILKRLATYIEKAVKLQSQVKSAMVYPSPSSSSPAALSASSCGKVIPTFASLFSGLGAELPLPTRVVIAASDNLVAVFPVPAGAWRRRDLRLQAVLRDRERPARRRRGDVESADSRQHSSVRSRWRDSAARWRR
jgi:type IV pilus assembly protein PilC